MPKPAPAPSIRVAAGIGALLLFAAYWLIFAITSDDGLAGGARSALNNTVPAVALALITHVLLDRFVWPGPRWLQWSVQIPSALAFALAWYIAILVIRGLRSDWVEQGFSLAPFAPVAFVWQMFQGVTFYALVALASLAIWLSRRIDALVDAASRPPSAAALTSILVKTQDETRSVAVDDIVRVSGAGDYSEIVLSDRTVLSTSRLSRFEAVLPAERFIRAHRSHLVRVGAIRRTEPAGNGRTTVHLSDGSHIVSSRAGARLLREAAL